MPITVNDINKKFTLLIESEDDKIEFVFKQLTYHEKSKIVGLTQRVQSGQVITDTSLNCFYVLKYGLESVSGVLDENGEEWKLEKEDEGDRKVNTDAAIDTLLNSSIQNQLIISAINLLDGIPKEIRHPISGQPVKGVEIKSIGGLPKK